MSNAHTGYLILVGLLGVIFPALSMLSARRTKEILIAEPDKKVLVYRQTFSMLWVFTGLILLAMWWVGDAIHLIGLSFLNRPLPIIGLLFLGLAFLRLTMHLKLSEKRRKWWYKQYEHVIFLLPENQEEHRWLIWVSFTAGICEEIIFRGFLYWQFSGWMPVLPALLLANFIFALWHSASGWKNAVFTFLIGIVFSLIYLATDSLWLPMLLHIITDLFAANMAMLIRPVSPAQDVLDDSAPEV